MADNNPKTTHRAWCAAILTGLVSVALIASLVVGCGGKNGDDDGASSAGSKGGGRAPATGKDAEFTRHLRQGIEQLRRSLAQSARAEFDKCVKIRADDPELMFHRARLAFLTMPPDVVGAASFLDRVIAVRPDHIPARRMRYAMSIGMRDTQRAQLERREIVERLGAPGVMEMDTFDGMLRGSPNVQFGSPAAGAENIDVHREIVAAFRKLERRGNYDPGTAVPALERLLDSFSGLAAVRLYYARLLIEGQVRFDSRAEHPDLPPMSSKIALDMAQSQFERVIDQTNPRLPLSFGARLGLAKVALQMGDYDDAIVHTQLLIDMPGVGAGILSEVLGIQGLAKYKQERFAEAIALYKRALQPIGGKPAPYDMSHRWLLHLAYEAAATPAADRDQTFQFRADLPMSGAPGGLSFVDIAPALGIDKFDGLGPSAWSDYDGDGDEDLFVCGCDSYGAMYRNDGEKFVDVTREAGLFHSQSGYGSTFADIDNDGDPDLYITRDGWNGPARNGLYRNNGDGTFTDITDESGLGDPGSSFVHAWSDVDRDGDLDLYVANGITGSGDTNKLYKNDGKGKFTNATEACGLTEASGIKTIGVAFGDYDDDGWPDIFVSGHNRANRLYHNRGDGTFEEVAEKAGVLGMDSLGGGYVTFFMDYDCDGDADILRTTLAPWSFVLHTLSAKADPGRRDSSPAMLAEMKKHTCKLYRNDGGGKFADVTVKAGFVHPIGTMGANVGDMDNDGYVDVYLGTGDPEIARMEPDRFYRNNGDGTFTDVTFAVGLGNIGKGHGVTLIDLDRDGDLEIYAPEGGFVHGDPWRNAMYRNDRDNDNHWLQIRLVGTKSNRDAIGTRIIVTAGDRRHRREHRSGQGFGSTNSRWVHFGLGEATKIRVSVRWPSGAEQTFDDIPVDTRIFLREGESWQKR